MCKDLQCVQSARYIYTLGTHLDQNGDGGRGHPLRAPLGAVVGSHGEVVHGLALKVEVRVAGSNLATDRVDLERGLLGYLQIDPSFYWS